MSPTSRTGRPLPTPCSRLLRDSRDVFVDARERVQGLSDRRPRGVRRQSSQTIGNDIQTSMSGVGNELGQLGSSELDEAAEDVPECDEVASAA